MGRNYNKLNYKIKNEIRECKRYAEFLLLSSSEMLTKNFVVEIDKGKIKENKEKLNGLNKCLAKYLKKNSLKNYNEDLDDIINNTIKGVYECAITGIEIDLDYYKNFFEEIKNNCGNSSLKDMCEEKLNDINEKCDSLKNRDSKNINSQSIRDELYYGDAIIREYRDFIDNNKLINYIKTSYDRYLLDEINDKILEMENESPDKFYNEKIKKEINGCEIELKNLKGLVQKDYNTADQNISYRFIDNDNGGNETAEAYHKRRLIIDERYRKQFNNIVEKYNKIKGKIKEKNTVKTIPTTIDKNSISNDTNSTITYSPKRNFFKRTINRIFNMRNGYQQLQSKKGNIY